MKSQKKTKDQVESAYLRLLVACHDLSNDRRAQFPDLRMRCPAAEKIAQILKRNQCYRWKKIGEGWHLIPLDSKLPSVAYIVPEKKKGVFTVVVPGRQGFSEQRRNLPKIKAEIEQLFTVLPEDEIIWRTRPSSS